MNVFITFMYHRKPLTNDKAGPARDEAMARSANEDRRLAWPPFPGGRVPHFNAHYQPNSMGQNARHFRPSNWTYSWERQNDHQHLNTSAGGEYNTIQHRQEEERIYSDDEEEMLYRQRKHGALNKYSTHLHQTARQQEERLYSDDEEEMLYRRRKQKYLNKYSTQPLQAAQQQERLYSDDEEEMQYRQRQQRDLKEYSTQPLQAAQQQEERLYSDKEEEMQYKQRQQATNGNSTQPPQAAQQEERLYSDDEEERLYRQRIKSSNENSTQPDQAAQSDTTKMTRRQKRRLNARLRQQENALSNDQPVPHSSQKRPAASTSHDGPSKKSKMPEPLGEKIAIIPENFPDEKILMSHLGPIQEVVIKHLLDAPDPIPKITFGNIVAGVLNVYCSDRDSINWVTSVIEEGEIAGFKLKVVETKVLPKPIKMAWKTRITGVQDSKVLLQLLQKCNPSLHTEEWKIVDVSMSEMSSRRIILMDRISADFIRDAGYVLHSGIDVSAFKLLEDTERVRDTDDRSNDMDISNDEED